MFERAAPDFVPSDASRMAGLATFEMLASRVADWRPDFTNPAADAHLVWATMHGLVTIEFMHRRWGGPTRRAPAGRSGAELRDSHPLSPRSASRSLSCPGRATSMWRANERSTRTYSLACVFADRLESVGGVGAI